MKAAIHDIFNTWTLQRFIVVTVFSSAGLCAALMVMGRL